MVQTVRRNQPVSVLVIHDGKDALQYVLHVNGVDIAGLPFDPQGIRFTFPTVDIGDYDVSVFVVGVGGERVQSDIVPVKVEAGIPGKPSIRIEVGTITIQMG